MKELLNKGPKGTFPQECLRVVGFVARPASCSFNLLQYMAIRLTMAKWLDPKMMSTQSFQPLQIRLSHVGAPTSGVQTPIWMTIVSTTVILTQPLKQWLYTQYNRFKQYQPITNNHTTQPKCSQYCLQLCNQHSRLPLNIQCNPPIGLKKRDGFWGTRTHVQPLLLGAAPQASPVPSAELAKSWIQRWQVKDKPGAKLGAAVFFCFVAFLDKETDTIR